MKVLIVSTFDNIGGAARAAYRLHQSLLNKGVESQMLVQTKGSDDSTVIGPRSKVSKFINLIRPTLDSIPTMFYRNKKSTLFSPSVLFSHDLIKTINEMDPDIVHLHWINGGMIRIEDLSKIKSPIVWTLHDMWAFTGGCHYDDQCRLYERSCGNCPALESGLQRDLSHRVLKRKSKTYSKIDNLTVIGVSKWLTNCAEKSKVFNNIKTVSLPNPLDTKIFKPCEKTVSRTLWNLPEDKRLILFGALGSTSDTRKGFEELHIALNKIKRNDIAFVVFGATEPQNPPKFDCNVYYVGTLSDELSLVSLYSAVDVMIVPSRQEAFGQTASEAMACGTPVVTFNHTGLVDIVDHKVNGYLARELDTTDLARGIEWVLDNKQYSELCLNARKKIVSKFESDVVASNYIETYKSALNKIN